MSATPTAAQQREESPAPSSNEVTAAEAAEAKQPDADADTAAPVQDEKQPAAAGAAAAEQTITQTPDPQQPCRKKQKMYTPLLPDSSTLGITPTRPGEIKLNFAQRLMELLEKEDVQPLLHWTKDGRRIVIEDVTRFSEEVMPRYFSDTKYKSFMVRVKRWGFRVVTPRTEDVATDRVHTSKILECELFRRDKPDLCLLMGDERRVDRAKAAVNKKLDSKNAKKKNKSDVTDTSDLSAKKKRDYDATAAAAETTAAAAVTSSTLHSSAPESSRYTSQLAARLEYQRLENMMRYNEMLGRYSNLAPSATRSLLAGYRGGLASSFLPRSGTGAEFHSHERAEAFASVTLHSIERDIQQCIETIAAHQDRLAMLQSIKEMKLGLSGSAGVGFGGGYSSLLAQQHHP